MKIILGVTGSISAYRALDLTRKFTKEGNKVRVILTKGGERFVRAEVFTYLGAERVYTSEDDFKSYTDEEAPILHISLTKWAHKLVIAPLSANTLKKLCSGSADDLLSSVFLAWKKDRPILLFPAMNTEMLTHPFVQENIKKISTLPNIFFSSTKKGKLACGDTGEGKLLDIEEIAELTYTINLESPKKNILLTAGATLSPLDDVRFLTNASTGKTAVPFIRKLLEKGHTVSALIGIYATTDINLFKQHPRFTCIRVTTTQDMLNEVKKFFPKCDIYISSAAIGDIEFSHTTGKIKKGKLDSSLKINSAPDILESVIKEKKENQTIIGFAAEKELSDDVLFEKIQRKPVDLLIGTKVHSGLVGDESRQGFGTNSAFYRIIKNNKETIQEGFLSKEELANTLLTSLGVI